MTEIELLKKLVELEKEKYSLKIKIDIWSRDSDVSSFKVELAQLEEEVTEIIYQLKEIDDKSYSQKAKIAMDNQISAYITEINKAKPGLKLSRNQGLGLENYLFSGILNDLRYYIVDEVYGHRIPAYLLYTYSNEKSIEVTELSDFLKKELQILRKIENPNYIKLRDYFESFENKIIEAFIK